MWSKPDEYALGLGLRVIDSTFYFFLRRFSYRATVGREGERLILALHRSKCDLDLSEIAAMLHRNGYALSTIRRHPFRKWFLQAKPQRDLNPRHAADIPRFTIIKIKCGVSSPQIQSQSTFIQLTPHFTVLDIWKEMPSSAFRSMSSSKTFWPRRSYNLVVRLSA